MPKTIFESVTVMQSGEPPEQYATAKDVMKELLTMHPEWRELHCRLMVEFLLPGKEATLHIKIVDPHANDRGTFWFWCAMFVTFLALVYLILP